MPSRKIIADLHTHSTASDGDCTPVEVVQEAHALGLKAVALTDHDTLNGLDDALQAGKEYGLTVICGIEVSLRFKRPTLVGTIHYLVYFPSSLLYNRDFQATTADILHQGRGHHLVVERVAAINALFGPHGNVEPMLQQPLTIEEIEAEGTNITRRHFALALAQRHGLDREKVNRLIGNSSPAYVPSGVDLHQLRPLFERFSVVRVLAHAAAGSFPAPSIYNEVLPPVETVESMLPELFELGLDGLEVYYPGHTPDHIDRLNAWAHTHRLLVTGGSDFHDRIRRPLGVAGVERSDLDALLMRLR